MLICSFLCMRTRCCFVQWWRRANNRPINPKPFWDRTLGEARPSQALRADTVRKAVRRYTKNTSRTRRSTLPPHLCVVCAVQMVHELPRASHQAGTDHSGHPHNRWSRCHRIRRGIPHRGPKYGSSRVMLILRCCIDHVFVLYRIPSHMALALAGHNVLLLPSFSS